MNLIAGNASIGQSYLLFIRKSLTPQYRGQLLYDGFKT
nr:MAG TPA: hypothetical protein [Caudoviricetes sp.]DAK13994.1 MAG TPA: hypothetical protein [Caudoviricetes sp.]